MPEISRHIGPDFVVGIAVTLVLGNTATMMFSTIVPDMFWFKNDSIISDKEGFMPKIPHEIVTAADLFAYCDVEDLEKEEY